jgi:LysR family transcriptional regulator for bpeEF and oprC
VARSVGVVHLGLYASPGCLDRHGAPREPEALSNMPRLGWLDQRGGGIFVPWRLERDDGTQTDVPGVPARAVGDSDVAVAAAAGGAGVVVAAPFAVWALVVAGRLSPVLPQREAGRRTVSLLLPSSRQLSARVRCFVDWAVERLRHDPALALRPRDLAGAQDGQPSQEPMQPADPPVAPGPAGSCC